MQARSLQQTEVVPHQWRHARDAVVADSEADLASQYRVNVVHLPKQDVVIASTDALVRCPGIPVYTLMVRTQELLLVTDLESS